MPEAAQPTPDSAGVTRTPTGEIATSPSPTPTPETIVRPEPTPTKSEATAEPEKSDGKETREPGKSLINEKSTEEGAPTEYTEFKVPEGFELDKAVAGEASALFKKNNLSQTQAQEFVDFYVKHAQESSQAPFKAWQDTQDQWRNDINSDSEIGGSKLN